MTDQDVCEAIMEFESRVRVAAMVPLVGTDGEQFGFRLAPCSTDFEVQVIRDELAAVGKLCARKVIVREGPSGTEVANLPEFIYSSVEDV